MKKKKINTPQVFSNSGRKIDTALNVFLGLSHEQDFPRFSASHDDIFIKELKALTGMATALQLDQQSSVDGICAQTEGQL